MKTIQELAIEAMAGILAQAPNQDDVAAAIREAEENSPYPQINVARNEKPWKIAK